MKPFYPLVFQNVVLCLLFGCSMSTPTLSRLDHEETCGRSNNGQRESKILSGEDVIPHEFPWMVSISRSASSANGHFCGGFVISSRHIISAAHCFYRKYNPHLAYSSDEIATPDSIAVSLGQHEIYPGGSDTALRVARISVHPDFDKGGDGHLNHDIALLETSHEMVWNDTLFPICLSSSSLDDDVVNVGDPVIVAGWGNTNCYNSKIRPAKTLQKVSIPIWNPTDCATAYQEANYDFGRKDYVCAGDQEKDTSKVHTYNNGDSGSPLMSFNVKRSRWTAIGIVSAGRFMCEDRVPGIYTKVSSYMSWIQSQIQ